VTRFLFRGSPVVSRRSSTSPKPCPSHVLLIVPRLGVPKFGRYVKRTVLRLFTLMTNGRGDANNSRLYTRNYDVLNMYYISSVVFQTPGPQTSFFSVVQNPLCNTVIERKKFIIPFAFSSWRFLYSFTGHGISELF